VIRPSRDLVRTSAAPRRPRGGRLRRLARALAVSVASAVCAALAVLAPADPAQAADAPDSLTIVGPGISLPISITANAQRDLFSSVLRQVSWMSRREGDFAKSDPKTLGPAYTVTVCINGMAAQVYDVYPEAAGGPRAHRPEAQPKGQVADAWFYATVTLPSVLRSAGVPLAAPVTSGPAGAMAYEDPYQPAAVSMPVSASLNRELGQIRLALAITAAAAAVVLLMLFGAARASRRRWSR
jgi:hypothetical protein